MRIRSPLLTKLAARLTVWLIRMLFRTLKIEIHLSAPELNPYVVADSECFLYCVWHDAMLPPIFCGSHPCSVALVSRHQDGSYLADALKLVGMLPVRGSTKRGGGRAVRQLLQQSAGSHIVITPDGPRGPRRELKDGILFLASHSGRKIVPVGSACSRSWRFTGSWTDLMIPKPFSKLALLAGEPIEIPPNLSCEEFRRYRNIVQTAMQQTEHKAERLAHGKVEPDPQQQVKRAA